MVSKNGRLLTTAGKIRGTKDMKKLYSKQLGSEVYALAPEQLKVFASSGYEVPTPEAVIADAGAIRIVPPVYQCVEDNNIAWHCGTSGAYVHPRCRNENSIGIEVRPYKLDKSTARSAAPADWYFPPEIVDNLVVFTQMLMQKYNVPLENVVRHYDVTGKWCPRPWMGDDTNTYYGTSGNEQWKKFKERLSGEELDMNIEEARKQLTSCADTGDTPSAWARDAAEFCKRKGIFNGDGAGNYGWQQPITREAVAQILYNAFESAGMLDAIPDKK